MESVKSATNSAQTSSFSTEKPRWQALAAGAGIVVVVTLGFFLLFFNRFAGIRTANGAALGGSIVLHGGVPYRDFFLPVPPLNVLENALWTYLFGTALIAQRIVGLVERLFIATVLYLWLARVFRISSATLGVIVAIVVSAGEIADPINFYHCDAILWAILAGFFAGTCLEWKSSRTASLAAFFCGISAGLCFSDYQSIGLGITVAVPVLVAVSLWKAKGYQLAARFAAWFCAGWVVPIAAISYWLHRHGVLELCLRDCFLKGPSTKAGSPTDFITRWIVVTLKAKHLLPGFIIAVILLILVAKLLFYPVRLPAEPKRDNRALVFVAVLSAVSIGAGALAAYAGLTPWAPIIKASVYFTLLVCGLLAAVFSMGFLAGKLSDLQQQFWLLATVSFVCAFMLSLSWPAWETMTLPGLGFLVAAFLDLSSRRARAACYLASVVLLFSSVVWKLWNPSAFNNWREPPVMSANTTPSLPELWGFRLPKPEVVMLEGAARIIREHSTPQDIIFTYPTMPIFYAISHRGWPGFAINHNTDFCPNDVARADAAAILREKPAVIIYYRRPAEFRKEQEMLWRGGKKTGQGAIIAAVEELIKNYKLAASYPAPPTRLTVDVYVRH